MEQIFSKNVIIYRHKYENEEKQAGFIVVLLRSLKKQGQLFYIKLKEQRDMVAERDILIKKANSFSALLDSIPCYVKEIWVYLVGFIRTHYIVDEIWDGHSELKFRRSGKTLMTLYLKPDKVSVLIILGKSERESFELQFFNFSEYINRRYNDSTTYHDGKWIMFDVKDMQIAREITMLANIKKKPNRKIGADSIVSTPCGAHCDICLINKSRANSPLRQYDAELGLVKCYGSLIKYSEKDCAGCECYHCSNDQRPSSCRKTKPVQCGKKSFRVDPGLCAPGLTACEVTDFIMPFCKGKNEVLFNDGLRINDKDK